MKFGKGVIKVDGRVIAKLTGVEVDMETFEGEPMRGHISIPDEVEPESVQVTMNLKYVSPEFKKWLNPDHIDDEPVKALKKQQARLAEMYPSTLWGIIKSFFK